MTKLDVPAARARWPKLRAALSRAGFKDSLAISALTGEHVPELLQRTHALVQALPPPAPLAVESVPVLRPVAEDEDAFAIERLVDGSWRVTGRRIERTSVMTDWDNEDAVDRFQRVLYRLGIDTALRDAGVATGDTVHVGDAELHWAE
jgi:GTP-binding protein